MATQSTMEAAWASSFLSNGDAYLEALFEVYQRAPQELPEDVRQFFASQISQGKGRDVSHDVIRDQFIHLTRRSNMAIATSGIDSQTVQQALMVQKLIAAYRALGHTQATLDPLGLTAIESQPELALTHYGLSSASTQTFNSDIPGLAQATLSDCLARLQQIYCGHVGIEYSHVPTREQQWLQTRIENGCLQKSFSPDEKNNFLARLTAAEGLERYLGTRFVGQKRFSLEGGDALIPLLDTMILHAGQMGAHEVVIGMAHRGRLNVLVNILGKAPTDLFNEFEGKYAAMDRSGDVKYHQGFSSSWRLPGDGAHMHLALAFNPSHLEIIAPVVAGSVRAKQQRSQDQSRDTVIPIAIHGDAAFTGQGVVMETFNFSQTRAYGIGGTLHIIVNNQVGFTTSNFKDARSTRYCSDVAKMLPIPIFHVNGDDVEAVVRVAELAVQYRQEFHCDVVIDLVCYRRFGHNEADEPSATQPVMYSAIKQHKTARQLYAEQLINEKIITIAEAEALANHYRDALDAGLPVVPYLDNEHLHPFSADWTPYVNTRWDIPTKTAVAKDKLQTLAQTIEQLPAGFTLQPQVAKLMHDRAKMTVGELPLNWGYAETLAYATLLDEGYVVRMTGQDCGRGTFAHRHAILHDQTTDEVFIPLQRVVNGQNKLHLYDSTLSEEAVLAFEYGYASAEPHGIIIWEAQFGDFANGAQVVFDQFISSGEQKWGRYAGLTMLLPHGFEGQGPEHSSARLERYLQLCAQNNMQVCVPTTPAQIFHLLRRQVLRPYRKPLVILSPKSLLRHKLAVSSLDELATGEFALVIAEHAVLDPKNVTSVILCSGKVYYDLLEKREKDKLHHAAILRIEQLYPFPGKTLGSLLAAYPNMKKLVWCQEEPKNQGAWYCSQHHFVACLQSGQTLHYAGRAASAAPAVGSLKKHQAEQEALVNEAFSI